MTYEFLNDLLVDLSSTGVHVSELQLSPRDFDELLGGLPAGKLVWRVHDYEMRVKFDAGGVEIKKLIILD